MIKLTPKARTFVCIKLYGPLYSAFGAQLEAISNYLDIQPPWEFTQLFLQRALHDLRDD